MGTRLLPATKSQPKEMLPVARKPIVQYVVEELVSNGIQQVLFVTGRSKASIENHFDQHGFGLWAVGVVDGASFIGFVGVSVVPFDAHFTPAVEVGWRLAREHWGRGYATEGARAALAFAFGDVGLAEVVSFTAVANRRSRAVMERLGMTHDPVDDFDHPRLAPDSPILRHVLYRLHCRTR